MKHVVLTSVFKNINEAFFLDGVKKNEPLHLLLAVSGGADSIAMLTAVCALKKKLNCGLSVITVDHNIRPPSESAADAAFSAAYCKKLGVECKVVTLPKGCVANAARERKKGIEEAARFLRYRAFEKELEVLKKNAAGAARQVCCTQSESTEKKRFLSLNFISKGRKTGLRTDGLTLNASFESGLRVYILTAHTMNDCLENVLMRLFQGADTQALLGIAKKRGCFLRPMIELPRREVEDFLNLQGISWREDSTNRSPAYLRNRIRSSLIPALEMTFTGWQKGLLHTLEKISAESGYVRERYRVQAGDENWRLEPVCNGTVQTVRASFKTFALLPPLFKQFFLKEGFNRLHTGKRIPYSVFKRLCAVSETESRITAGGFCLEKRGSFLFLFEEKESSVSKSLGKHEGGYMVWIEKAGEVKTPLGNFIVTESKNFFFVQYKNESFAEQKGGAKEGHEAYDRGIDDGINYDNSLKLGPFSKPFCIRSRLPGDEIFFEGLGTKSLKKLINEQFEDYEMRALLPIIEEKGTVRGIYGSVFGKKNWYSRYSPFDRRKK